MVSGRPHTLSLSMIRAFVPLTIKTILYRAENYSFTILQICLNDLFNP